MHDALQLEGVESLKNDKEVNVQRYLRQLAAQKLQSLGVASAGGNTSVW